MRILSVDEAAEQLGASARVVRYWCREGYLKNARKVGRDWVILASDVESFQKPKPGPKPRSAPKPRKKKEGKE